ncbi:phosphatase PAP2 family protein [Vibrio maritimus]|uniref:phosphatase PAP2 family protein n=1 Tax=Vibrio maritimus TaxID=990268 RepID=UPI001F3DBA96|nr:phosphatase PAP2 family protein [Vibrio maritimus]
MARSSSHYLFNFNHRVSRDLNDIANDIRSDAKLYLLIAAVTLCTFVFSSLYGYTGKLSFFSYMRALNVLVPISLTLAGSGYFFVLLLRREKSPIQCYVNKIKLLYQYRARIISSFVLLTAISIFMSAFSSFKGLIPIIHPFQYDLLFHQLDVWLFAGNEPWTVVHTLLDSPYITVTLNFCYNLWFFLMWGMVCYFLLSSKSPLRTRFFLSWLLSWTLLGMILAMCLSSAGPVFLSKLGYDNHGYGLLLQLLQQQDAWLTEHNSWGLFALETQQDLWLAYSEGKDMLGSGISAMPSMHVSMAVLMALTMNAINRTLGIVFWLYALVIFIGSISLGWHYALDGIVSAPLTWLIWWFAGKISHSNTQPKRLANA